jgi:hypothetical protein
MGGRPIGSKDRLPRGSLKAAWLRVAQAEPHLLDEAIRAGLTAGRPSERLGFLELGAKLMREVGVPSEPEAGAGAVDRVHIMLGWDPANNEDTRSLPLKTQSASGRNPENQVFAPVRALLPARFSD